MGLQVLKSKAGRAFCVCKKFVDFAQKTACFFYTLQRGKALKIKALGLIIASVVQKPQKQNKPLKEGGKEKKVVSNLTAAGYQILKILKQGENGIVYLAEHERLKTRRIVKGISRNNPGYERLVAEARIMQRFRSESIPIVYDIWDENENTFFSEEFIEGESLKDYLNRKSSISNSEILDLSLKLCEIVIYIHNPAHRVLHLDIKPENIMVTDQKLKLIDFGSAICRGFSDEPNVITGTPEFCAPEQMEGGTPEITTDIFALGRIFEYMLLYAPVAPKGYKKIITGCLRQEGHFESAEEVKRALLNLPVKKVKKYEMGHWFAVTGIPTDYHSSDFAFGLANQLQKKGKKVILLDVNEKRNLECLEERRDAEKEPLNFLFTINGITVAKRVLPEDVKGWRGRGYDYVICDFGCQSPICAEVPFEKTFCVGSVTPWTLTEWRNALPMGERSSAFAVCVTEGSAALLKECKIRCRVLEAKPLHSGKNVTRCISGH